MNKLSVWEFEQLCTSRTHLMYTFESSMQPSKSTLPFFNYRFIGLEVVCILHPNIICFKNGNQFVRFGNVKSVEIISDDSDNGLVFDIICGNNTQNSEQSKYRLTAK